MKARRWLAQALALTTTMLLLVAQANAATRAWLDRSEVAAGDTVTLNIETDQATATPDYGPLRSGFELAGQSSSRQLQMVNGRGSVKSQFGVMLTPRGDGLLTIPALTVGKETTQPLHLRVSAGGGGQAATGGARTDAAAGASAPDSAARGDARVFVQTSVDDRQPYVQQSVGVLVKLYFATQLASGQLDLDTPEGASLQRVGDDVNSVQTVNGRQYNVVERRFVLVPERSGPLSLPGARFSGQALGGFFDDAFGRGDGGLNARSAGQVLQVRAQPDGAPQPWLPLHDLRLRYTATPQQAIAGQAAQVVVEATAQGGTRAQFPELPAPVVPGAQVFAEPAQYDERFIAGVPQVKVTRRYSVVPAQAGKLTIPGVRLGWWDVAAGAAREARLPDLALEVSPGNGAFAAPAPTVPAVRDTPAVAAPAPAAASRPWPWIALAVVLAVLWLATLAWGWRQRRARGAAMPALPVRAPAGAVPSQAELRRALEGEGLDEVVRVLCAMAGVGDLDQVMARLQSESQRAALARMQRARWAGEGDPAAARQALREAFKGGPQWRPATAASGRDEVGPLYPRR